MSQVLSIHCFLFLFVVGTVETQRQLMTAPRSTTLIDFWTMKNGFTSEKNLGTLTNESNIKTATGPFGIENTALGVINNDRLFELVGGGPGEKNYHSQFTLSFFIFLDTNFHAYNATAFFEMFESGDTGSCLVCVNLENTTTLGVGLKNSASIMIPVEIVQTGSWHFFAFTANLNAMVIYHSDESSQFTSITPFSHFTPTRPVPPTESQVLYVGSYKNVNNPRPLRPQNLMSCAMLWPRMLTSIEVGFLPTSCQSAHESGNGFVYPLPDVPRNIGNILYFNPLASGINQTMIEDIAKYQPTIGIDVNSTNVAILDQCQSCASPSDVGSMNPFGFTSIAKTNNPNGIISNSYVQFGDDEIGEFSISFYFKRNTEQPKTMLVLSNTNYSQRIEVSCQGSNDIVVTLFINKRLINSAFASGQCVGDKVLAIVIAGGNISMYNVGTGFDSIATEMALTGDVSGWSIIFNGPTLLQIGGGFDNAGLLNTIGEGNEMACVFVYNHPLPVTKLTFPETCRFIVTGQQLTTTSSTTTTTPDSTATTTLTKDDTLLSGPLQDQIPMADFSSTQPLTLEDVMKECDHFLANLAAPPNNNQSTMVDFAFHVSFLHEINTVTEIISVGGSLLMHWTVTTCLFNQSTIFSEQGQRPLYVASTKHVWVPNVRFQSSATSNIYMKGDDFGDDLTAQISFNGTNQVIDFWYLLQGKFDSFCPLNLALFPLDHQTCTIWFELTRPSSLVTFNENKLIFKWDASDANEWNKDSTDEMVVKRKFGGKVHQGVHFQVSLHRNSNYYLLYIIVPIFLLGIVDLATFLMPAQEPDRATLTITVLLALYFLQLDVLNRLPVIKSNVLLGDYVMKMTIFTMAVAVGQMFLLFILTISDANQKICSKRVTIIRLIDTAFVAIAIVAFIAIHVTLAAEAGM